jgi:hypothetical protein
MPVLWTKDREIEFFTESSSFATPEQLFYLGDDNRYYAYWPKFYTGRKSTLQSRNSLIGSFTEKFSVDLLQEFAESKGLYAVQGVVCEEIGLSKLSPADVAICSSRNTVQNATNIHALFEVKMSIVWNWELKNNKCICLGDFKTHKGNPGLLRSDSMLKAIGKSINIRVSGYRASKIPIIILGNTPITKSYYSKVDHLKKAGIIQGFWSVNTNPLDNNGDNIKNTHENGFVKMDSYSELESNLEGLFSVELEFFSSMRNKNELGKIIELANQELEYEQKAEKFLSLIRE